MLSSAQHKHICQKPIQNLLYTFRNADRHHWTNAIIHLHAHTQHRSFLCVSGEATTWFHCIVIYFGIRLSKEFIQRCRECRCSGETQIDWNIEKKMCRLRNHTVNDMNDMLFFLLTLNTRRKEQTNSRIVIWTSHAQTHTLTVCDQLIETKSGSKVRRSV